MKSLSKALLTTIMTLGLLSQQTIAAAASKTIPITNIANQCRCINQITYTGSNITCEVNGQNNLNAQYFTDNQGGKITISPGDTQNIPIFIATGFTKPTVNIDYDGQMNPISLTILGNPAVLKVLPVVSSNQSQDSTMKTINADWIDSNCHYSGPPFFRSN